MKKSVKSILMDFVASFPEFTQFTWSELHEFLVLNSLDKEETEDYFASPRKYRGRFNAGFSTPSLSQLSRGIYLRPTKDDSRFLLHLSDGTYILYPQAA